MAIRAAASAAPQNFALETLIVTAAAVSFSVFAWLSSTRARRQHDKLESQRVEAEAFQRAQGIYTSAIQVLEKRVVYLDLRNTWLEERTTQLEVKLGALGVVVKPPEPPPLAPDIPPPIVPPLSHD